MKFSQVNDNRWESDKQAYSAVAFNGNREAVGVKEPKFVIEKDESRGKVIFRVREQRVGRKETIGRFKTLEQAIKAVEE